MRTDRSTVLAVLGVVLPTGLAYAEFDAADITSRSAEFIPNATVTHLYATGDVHLGDTLLSIGYASITPIGERTFYQHGLGTDFAPNASIIPLVPEIFEDSFVTFNRLTSTDDFTGGDPDLEMSETALDGGWFWIPGNGQGEAVEYERSDGSTGVGVLIAQLTVIGDDTALPYAGSLTLFTSGGSPDGVDVKVIPTPGGLMLLGGAACFARRRRRR